MGRLIDADDAINVFTNRLFETLKTNLPCVTAEENQICLETCYKVAKYEIDTIPTAYNVEKVVDELMVLHEEGYCPNEDSLECVLDKACSDCYREKIIDIVKSGGCNETIL